MRNEKPKVIVASNNEKKIVEIKNVLTDYNVLSLKDISCEVDIPETALTFKGNALLKAEYIVNNHNVSCFSDDSGLVVPALDGAPGIHSARYAGEHKNDDDNINKLLNSLKSVSDRRAYFITVICYHNGDKAQYFEGKVSGTITKEKRGNMGFGYDPIFQPDGFDKTFAEMTLDEKQEKSHRARALKKFVDKRS